MTKTPAPTVEAAQAGFEQALAELEAIVQRMEDGQLALEESLTAYQRGTELVKFCEGRLAEAQARIAVLEGDTLRDLKVGDA